LVCMAIITAVGCGNSSDSPTVGSSTSPTTIATVDPALNYGDPQAVCSGLTRAVFTRDAAVDSSESESYRRTRPYLTAQAYGGDGGATGGRNSVTWQEWVTHRARTTVTVEPFIGDGFDAVAGQQAVAVTATVTPRGDGWQGATTTHNVFCTLSENPAGTWRVTRYDIEDLIDTP
jgi:hypothetical protein